MAEETLIPDLQENYENITPWNGANDRGRDVRMKWERNFEKVKNNFSILNTKLSILNLFSLDEDNNLRIDTNVYSTGGLSAYGKGSSSGSGNELVQTVYGYNDLGGTFSDTDLTNTFNAYTVNRLASRLTAIEQGSLKSVDWGIISNIPSWIGVTKPTYTYQEVGAAPAEHTHSQYLTEHQSLAAYALKTELPTDIQKSNWSTAYSNTHTHSNKAVIDGITSTLVGNWNTAYTNNHTHSNRAALDKITLDADGNIMIEGNVYSTGGLSAYGTSSSSGGGGGIIQTVYGYTDLGGTFSDTDLASTFNAYTINRLASRLSSVESGALTSVDWGIIANRPTKLSQFSNDPGFVTSDTLDGLISHIEGLLNSLSLKNEFDELIAGYIAVDVLSAGNIYADMIYSNIDWSNVINKPAALKNPYALSFGGKTYDGSSSQTITAADLGALTGISSSQITTALGYTPYNSTNPNGYVTGSIVNGYATQTWVSSNFNNYTLPTATDTILGGVKVGTGLGIVSSILSVSYGTAAGTACQGNDSRLSNSRPASDVYAWAKSATKPSYTKSEIGLGSVDNTADAIKSVLYAASAGKVTNSLSWSGYNSGSFDGSAVKSFTIPSNTSQITESTNNLYYTDARALNALDNIIGSIKGQLESLSLKNEFDELIAGYIAVDVLSVGSVYSDILNSKEIKSDDYVQIGNIKIMYDSSNNCLKIIKSDGTAANLLITGGITAYS